MRYLPLLIIATFSLQSCTTLSRDDCGTVDWYGIGYEDGLQGRVPRPVAEPHRACTTHDIASPLARYSRGRGEGLKQFCSALNGFRLGSEGTNYNGVCLADAEREFLPAYGQGKEIFNAERQIRRLGEILQVNTSELHNLTASAQQKEVERLAHDTTPERRADLLLEVHELQETVAMVETEINGIEAALEEENRQLQNLRKTTRYR